MRKWSIKKADDSIQIVHCDQYPSFVLESGDTIISELQDSDLPDRRFRECWIDNEGSLELDLSAVRAQRTAEVRVKRDRWLLQNDAKWAEASKKGEDTTDILSDAEALRDLPADIQVDLSALITAEDIASYDPFPSLGLTQSYED